MASLMLTITLLTPVDSFAPTKFKAVNAKHIAAATKLVGKPGKAADK